MDAKQREDLLDLADNMIFQLDMLHRFVKGEPSSLNAFGADEEKEQVGLIGVTIEQSLTCGHPLGREAHSYLVLFEYLLDSALTWIDMGGEFDQDNGNERMFKEGFLRIYDAVHMPLLNIVGRIMTELAITRTEHSEDEGPSADILEASPELILDLSINGYRVWKYLRGVDVPATYDDVTAANHMGRSTCSKILKQMQSLGMIKRFPEGGVMLLPQYRHINQSEEKLNKN